MKKNKKSLDVVLKENKLVKNYIKKLNNTMIYLIYIKKLNNLQKK